MGKKMYSWLWAILPLMLLAPLMVFADGPAATGVPVVIPPVPPPVLVPTTELAEWVTQVFALFGDLKGYVAWQFKAVAVIYVLIGSIKVSVLAPLWDKLGKAKALVAPVLAMVAALFVTWGSGPLSLPTVFIALTTGAGALALADILGAVKQAPGVNPVWLAVVGFLEKVLKKPSTEAKK